MSGLVRASAATTALLGVALLIWSVARGASFPPAVTVALVGTGVLLMVLGWGLAQRARAAWSFGLATLGVLAVTGLLALPAIVRSGFPSIAAGLLLAIIIGLIGALVMGRDAY